MMTTGGHLREKKMDQPITIQGHDLLTFLNVVLVPARSTKIIHSSVNVIDVIIVRVQMLLKSTICLWVSWHCVVC